MLELRPRFWLVHFLDKLLLRIRQAAATQALSADATVCTRGGRAR